MSTCARHTALRRRRLRLPVRPRATTIPPARDELDSRARGRSAPFWNPNPAGELVENMPKIRTHRSPREFIQAARSRWTRAKRPTV